jgi:hypothetical protein
MTDLWVVAADMGYGHQRAVYPFREFAYTGIVNAGDTTDVTDSERNQWKTYLRLYETFSRAKAIPIIGKQLFGMLDQMLHIPSLYPIRNLSHSTMQVDMLSWQIRHGLGAGFIQTVSRHPLPILTSFYVAAIAADSAGMEPIYCIICDADLNRVWVAKEPWDSQINYFAPCGKAAQRLKSYGVPEERIFLTGFPFDDELLGGRELTTLKHDLAVRLCILDPTGRFHRTLGHSVRHILGEFADAQPTQERVLTLMYAVGGAGAQREIGTALLTAFRERIQAGTMNLVLSAGTRSDTAEHFFENVHRVVGDSPNAKVLYHSDRATHFAEFNRAIRSTDILWTKPSELSFYTGLGIPIIMSPTIGSQETFNRKWLLELGAGMRQEKPEHSGEWLFDLLQNGRFADMAWLGFLRARKLGMYHILDVLQHGTFERSDNPLLR